jgi:hypothetical protein
MVPYGLTQAQFKQGVGASLTVVPDMLSPISVLFYRATSLAVFASTRFDRQRVDGACSTAEDPAGALAPAQAPRRSGRCSCRRRRRRPTAMKDLPAQRGARQTGRMDSGPGDRATSLAALVSAVHGGIRRGERTLVRRAAFVILRRSCPDER